MGTRNSFLDLLSSAVERRRQQVLDEPRLEEQRVLHGRRQRRLRRAHQVRVPGALRGK